MAFESHKQDEYKKLLGKSVLFLLLDGSDVLVKVEQLNSTVIRGYDDEGLNVTIRRGEIADYMLP